jgi:DNA (cytosine-5)-methyltransferase 1
LTVQCWQRNKRKVTKSSPTYISLFSGCGGLDFGFNQVGYACVGAYDSDKAAVDTYNLNLSSAEKIARIADLRQWWILDFPTRHIDLVIAGPPCQGFSTIGRRDTKDPRNALLMVPAKVAVHLNAKAVIIENVPGVLAGTQATYWHKTEGFLKAAGFNCRTFVVDAGSVGLPQRRKRILLVASRHRSPLSDWPVARAHPGNLRSILSINGKLPNHNPRYLAPNSTAARIAEHILPGHKLCNVRASDSSVHSWEIPEVFGIITRKERRFLETLLRLRRRDRIRKWGDADPVSPERLNQELGRCWAEIAHSLCKKGHVRLMGSAMYDLSRTFNGKFRRLHPDKPTNCVLTRFCDPYYFLHPYENRGFTIREAARVQGFPDWFEFLGSEKMQAVQVGNAVPPPLAKMVADWALKNLL